MARTAKGDWPIGLIVVVPHAWRGDSLWNDIQAQTQDRIGAGLRTMYAELLQQPLSPELEKLVRKIATGLEASWHDD